MKNVQWITKVIIVITFFSSIGCSKSDDGGGGGGGDDFFIPDLSAKWVNKTDINNEFYFPDAQSGVNTGPFTVNENPNVPASTPQIHASGSFTNHHIEFTYDNSSGTKSGKLFSGTISDDSKQITLTNSTLGDLVLQKP